ncbi:cyclin-O protein B-like [Mya arenaria]|uniref:cyclin-O protein B-like n=1 Tax=Mya arenaria TaxID=6604 RepID=UPI0022E60C93|nr:cyclin-O protein B-like [Mya arenaria]XP_052792174.1 cyclin-O protein B-like [Mya arenaria]
MSAVLLQGNPTFCVVDDKTNTDGEEDEGIDCPSGTEVSLDQSLQITPPSAPECVSLSDSGFQKSNTSGVDLRCLEGVWEWPSTRKVRDAQCSCADQEHDGFEDYVHEIFTHRLSIENKYHVKSCLNNQPEISPDVRKMLIHWLTSVHHDLALCQDTLYLAVHVFDRVLDVMQVSRDCLELLGITCLLVASKQNEICPPEIHELLEKCNETYTREQVKQLELIVLMATSFDLMAPTVQQFLEYFASFSLAASTGDEEQTSRLKMARAMGRCALELSLQEYELCQFPPSMLALCVWNVAVETLRTTLDTRTVHYTRDIPAHQLETCFTHVHMFFDSFRQSGQDMSLLCEKYGNLYSAK